MMDHTQLLKRKRTFSEEGVDRILIGVTGGSAAGKTTLCENIQKLMSFDANFNVLLIALDSFYKPLDKTLVKAEDYNFDHPDALDFDSAYEVLKALMRGDTAEVPRYCFVTHSRLSEKDKVEPTEVIIFEGIFSLYDRRIRDLMKYKIFINCDDDVRLCRRIKRDVEDRGRTVEGVLYQYHRFVKGAYINFIAPTMRYADLVVPGFRNNKSSVTFIVEHLKTLTRQMQFYKSALTTRIYFNGEVIDILLQEGIDESDFYLDVHDQMEYIFPLSEETKKELDLFMNQLISERFMVSYFRSTYIHQFIRILRILFVKWLGVKKQLIETIQLFNILQFTDLTQLSYDESKTLHVVFVPHIDHDNYEQVLRLIDRRPEGHYVMILNLFCDHRYLLKMKKLKLCSITTLFCICDQRKFVDILALNVRDSKESLLHDQALIKRSLQLLQGAVDTMGQSDY